MNTRDESFERLLPLLRCPACRSGEPLEVRPGPPKTNIRIAFHHEHLLCKTCAAEYPITEDLIPIMWDPDLQRAFAGDQELAREACSAIDANKAVYDRVSGQYRLYARQDLSYATRMQNAVKRILAADTSLGQHCPTRSHGPVYHLDYGCGPGQVIGWLKEFGFLQIGLDVSLENLRNARKHTGCLVVCGNACRMPFADQSIDIVTQSAVLHHIPDWKSAIAESLRVCRKPGGIVLDSEPTKSQLAWSRLAVLVFNTRFPVYRVLSYFRRDKYVFRNPQLVKLNLQAEVHKQPGTGFPVEEVESLFTAAGFRAEIVESPSPELVSKPHPDWKSILLNVLSLRNPWNPKYGSFTAIASSTQSTASHPEMRAA